MNTHLKGKAERQHRELQKNSTRANGKVLMTDKVAEQILEANGVSLSADKKSCETPKTQETHQLASPQELSDSSRCHSQACQEPCHKRQDSLLEAKAIPE